MAEPDNPDAGVRCDTCGGYGALNFAERWLWVDCHAACGSCGAGGQPDLPAENSSRPGAGTLSAA